jgi:hypothetical protein
VAAALAILVGLLLAAGVYLGLERLGRAAWVPATLRALAWSLLGILLLDLSCARPPEATRPLVLLDASLSMGAAGSQWPAARAAAAALGEVRLIGAVDADSLPIGGRSTIASSLAGAVAGGRPVWLVTDGEIEDAGEVGSGLWARTGIRVLARAPRPDLAITRVSGPERIAIGDTLRLEIDVSGFGVADRRQATVEVRSGEDRWMSGVIPLSAGSGTVTLEKPIGEEIAAGAHLLSVTLRDAADQEPRTDVRFHALTVLATPGVVLLAGPGDWEGRFLFRTLSEVASLPIRGFLAIEATRWVRMGDLSPASIADVEQAVARADVLVRIGDQGDRFRSPARGRWEWISSRASSPPALGDWYLTPTGASPLAGAFIGLPVDSFPPAVGLSAVIAGPRDWIALSGQQNRRGAERPAVIGRDSAGRREVVVGAAGLWRWAFRGGSSDQAYRAWVASTITWLLGGADSVTGRARPVRSVVQRGRPIVFERLLADSAPLTIELRGSGGNRTDTLQFDGAGRASLRLDPGRYRYRLEGGGQGVLGVEEFSDEWLPRPVAIGDRPAIAAAPAGQAPLRDKWWLFGLAIVAFSGEWWWRRRAGLR